MSFLDKLFGRKREAASAETGPIQFLLGTPPGSASFCRVKESGGDILTVFAIHEDDEHVRRFPREVSIDVRSTFFDRGGVGVVIVMLRIEGELYETWWNFHNPSYGQCFYDMSKQDKLLISFYTDRSEPARTIWIPNPLRSGFGTIIKHLEPLRPWPMEAFDRAKADLCREFSTPRALWEGMV